MSYIKREKRQKERIKITYIVGLDISYCKVDKKKAVVAIALNVDHITKEDFIWSLSYNIQKPMTK